jgi:flagellin
MTRILTNVAANADLTKLQNRVRNVQNQISTDLSVDSAAGNAASTSRDACGASAGTGTAQPTLISGLQTSLNDRVGSLVDATLNMASTRLRALQVQQQLGVQSLSITSQSILKLFQ